MRTHTQRVRGRPGARVGEHGNLDDTARGDSVLMLLTDLANAVGDGDASHVPLSVSVVAPKKEADRIGERAPGGRRDSELAGSIRSGAHGPASTGARDGVKEAPAGFKWGTGGRYGRGRGSRVLRHVLPCTRWACVGTVPPARS